MRHNVGERIYKRQMTRRDFIWLTSVSTVGVMVGCATNPVTGKKQLMFMSEDQEVQVDKEHSPHQFSADYGADQDKGLNDYLTRVGKKMADQSHRPKMPYSFRCVNATYINAYAFPGGSIATTRGILLALENEAELAGLLGHELGHVNARHTADRMTKTMLAQTVIVGLAAYVQTEHEEYASLAAGLGGIGAGMLLARYSRDDERQADSLGMEYMVKNGHNPNGMVGLMDLLKSLSKHKPNALEMMFATHPMSSERYKKAKERAETTYKDKQKSPQNRERYMDHTKKLRAKKAAIEAMQRGENEMAREKFTAAETQFNQALKHAPNDYAALVMMSKCLLAQNKNNQAQRYATKAQQIYPREAQAHHLNGMSKLQQKKFAAAFNDFKDYEKMLPGNPNTIFLKGVSLEGMQNKKKAAAEFQRFLKIVNQGEQAEYAHKRLVDWGYIKQNQQK
ncbi:M48 family metalloprotease [candidate division CSSED10-310 bacterium]|uniref:M48 family metalloprotease n=1 Tax=candidate division CSSED10-310 bacterium TaxID=2855610 RepID=A0ABV6YX34_UNCC1